MTLGGGGCKDLQSCEVNDELRLRHMSERW